MRNFMINTPTQVLFKLSMTYTQYVAHMGEKRNTYRVSTGKQDREHLEDIRIDGIIRIIRM
jgi:hypothetical protein